MQSSRVCCAGSQIIRQTKTISSDGNNDLKKTREWTTIPEWKADMTGKHVEEGQSG